VLCPACGVPNSGKFCVDCGAAIAPPPVGDGARAELAAAVAAASSASTGVEHHQGLRGKDAVAYLSLQPSETAVLHAASRVFAAYVATGRVTDDNEPEMVNRAVRAALRLALVTEKLVQSDDEEW
jgi:hypothetical protein